MTKTSGVFSSPISVEGLYAVPMNLPERNSIRLPVSVIAAASLINRSSPLCVHPPRSMRSSGPADAGWMPTRALRSIATMVILTLFTWIF